MNFNSSDPNQILFLISFLNQLFPPPNTVCSSFDTTNKRDNLKCYIFSVIQPCWEWRLQKTMNPLGSDRVFSIYVSGCPLYTTCPCNVVVFYSWTLPLLLYSCTYKLTGSAGFNFTPHPTEGRLFPLLCTPLCPNILACGGCISYISYVMEDKYRLGSFNFFLF